MENQIKNFTELEQEISLNVIHQMLSANVKRKLNNMYQAMDIEKLNEFNLLKEEAKKPVQQRKCLRSESQGLEHFIEFLKDINIFTRNNIVWKYGP